MHWGTTKILGDCKYINPQNDVICMIYIPPHLKDCMNMFNTFDSNSKKLSSMQCSLSILQVILSTLTDCPTHQNLRIPSCQRKKSLHPRWFIEIHKLWLVAVGLPFFSDMPGRAFEVENGHLWFSGQLECAGVVNDVSSKMRIPRFNIDHCLARRTLTDRFGCTQPFNWKGVYFKKKEQTVYSMLFFLSFFCLNSNSLPEEL